MADNNINESNKDQILLSTSSSSSSSNNLVYKLNEDVSDNCKNDNSKLNFSFNKKDEYEIGVNSASYALGEQYNSFSIDKSKTLSQNVKYGFLNNYQKSTTDSYYQNSQYYYQQNGNWSNSSYDWTNNTKYNNQNYYNNNQSQYMTYNSEPYNGQPTNYQYQNYTSYNNAPPTSYEYVNNTNNSQVYFNDQTNQASTYKTTSYNLGYNQNCYSNDFNQSQGHGQTIPQQSIGNVDNYGSMLESKLPELTTSIVGLEKNSLNKAKNASTGPKKNKHNKNQAVLSPSSHSSNTFSPSFMSSSLESDVNEDDETESEDDSEDLDEDMDDDDSQNETKGQLNAPWMQNGI